MDNPQETVRKASLPDLPDGWVQVINDGIHAASERLEKAKSLEEVREAQGEIRAYKSLLTAKATAIKAKQIDAEIELMQSEEEAERERRRNTNGWRRFWYGNRRRAGDDS